MFLASNRQALLKQSVDYLPIGDFETEKNGIWGAGNAVHLAKALAKEDPVSFRDKPVADFFQAISDSSSDRGIISSEFFAYSNPKSLLEIVTRIREMGISVRAFYLIREQVQLLSAIYMQQVKTLQCTEGPLDFIRNAYPKLIWLRYQTFFARMADIFGRDNLNCGIFDSANMSLDELLQFSLDALAITTEDLNCALGEINTSLAPQDVPIMLFLNKLGPRKRFSDTIIKNANQLGLANFGRSHNIFPLVLVKEIRDFFAGENNAFATNYFKRDQLFPSPTPSEPADLSLEALTNKDLIAFFGGLLVRYDERIAALEEKLAKLGPLP